MAPQVSAKRLQLKKLNKIATVIIILIVAIIILGGEKHTCNKDHPSGAVSHGVASPD